MTNLARWAVTGGVACILLTGCTGAPPSVPAGAPGGGFSVDHPPEEAYQALVAFTRCMGEHHVQMPGPARWPGHGRLIIYYPPHDRATDAAYAACDHLKVLAKQQGGPHPAPGQPGQGNAGAITAARTYLSDLTRRQQFAGSVLVAKDGHVLFQAGYGWADAARRVPDTAATRYRIGSLTKQFTAMAILQLQDQGRLSVTDRLCRFVNGCPTAWKQVTLAELLTHTSGIPDYQALPGYGQLSRQHMTPAQLAALVSGKPPLFPPGTRWSYSNTGYVLLGMVIQKVSGQSYASFLSQRVLAPLGMRDTGYDVSHPSLAGHATGYVSAYRTAPYIDMSVPYAAGALYSTAGDLARWDHALLTGSPGLVRPATLREMFHPWVPVSPGYPDEGAYGYGWFIDLHGAEYDHEGLISGFVSSNAIFPHAGAEIIVLSNLESSDVRTITEHLAALIGLNAR